MEIVKDIFYTGVNDREITLFEGQYMVEKGMAYNSYVIMDEKIAVFDTVEKSFGNEWLSKVSGVVGSRTPDYLIVQHMEPDHSANIDKFMDKYPNAVIVATSKAFSMINQFFGNDYSERKLIVGEGDTLNLGSHELTFITAPMVHWPEVMLTYDITSKTLFSADAFGKFGTYDADEEWDCEARRYYIGIVGRFGVQVQNLLKKLAGTEVNRICPLHGPVLTENLEHYINLYDIWSSYKPETEGVAIAYTSVYGNTKAAVELLKEELYKAGCPKVSVFDLARCDMAEAVEDAFRYSKLVLATTTYNGGIFPFMKEFIDHLTERNYQNRTVAIMENGSWAPMAEKTIRAMLEKSKNLNFARPTVKILSALTEENKESIKELARNLL